MNQLKIIFKNDIETSEIIFDVLENKAGKNELSTQFGKFYAQEYSFLFKTGELEIDVTDRLSDKFEALLKWVNYQFLGTNNLFAPVQEFIDPDGKLVETAKTCPYQFKYIHREWCDEMNVWEEEVREKTSKLAKSQIKFLPCGKSVAPVWLIKKFLPNCFSKSIECVRVVKKSDLINLMYEHRNKLLST